MLEPVVLSQGYPYGFPAEGACVAQVSPVTLGNWFMDRVAGTNGDMTRLGSGQGLITNPDMSFGKDYYALVVHSSWSEQ